MSRYRISFVISATDYNHGHRSRELGQLYVPTKEKLAAVEGQLLDGVKTLAATDWSEQKAAAAPLKSDQDVRLETTIYENVPGGLVARAPFEWRFRGADGYPALLAVLEAGLKPILSQVL